MYLVRVRAPTFCAGAIVGASGRIEDCAPILRSIFRTVRGRTLVLAARARGFDVCIWKCQ